MSNTGLELIQMKLPEFYKKYEFKSETDKSVMYAILKALSDTVDSNNRIVKRLDAAIGIDTTYDEDLEHRWGSLLGISKKESESYDLYRNELKLVIPSLVGGTKESIIHAIAVAIGISKDNAIQSDYIDVVDGWEYTGDAAVDDMYRQPGSFVCTIDLSIGDNAINIENKVASMINSVKASGTAFCVLYKEFKVYRYYKLDAFRYSTLGSTTYEYLGME